MSPNLRQQQSVEVEMFRVDIRELAEFGLGISLFPCDETFDVRGVEVFQHDEE